MKLFIILAAFFAPHFAFAQRIGQQPQDIGDLAGLALNILALAIPLLIGLAMVVFLWGVFKYVVAKGATDQTAARNIIIAGLAGLFVMIAVWGLVKVLLGTFGFRFVLPIFPFGSSPSLEEAPPRPGDVSPGPTILEI